MLLWVFKPGLFFTALLLIILVPVHAVLAMAAMYYAESAFLGRVPVFLIAAVGFGAVAGVVAITRNVFSLVRNAGTLVIGKIASRNDAPDLWKRVDDIADQLGALRPESLVLGLDPNFFVTEADVTCLTGSCSGRTLYCSLPLMRILSTTEFAAIIGHELGHYKGLDTKFSQEFFPIYRGTADSIAALQETRREGAAVIALLPAIALLSYFLEAFEAAETRISRDRELIADKEGAVATDSRSMAPPW